MSSDISTLHCLSLIYVKQAPPALARIKTGAGRQSGRDDDNDEEEQSCVFIR